MITPEAPPGPGVRPGGRLPEMSEKLPPELLLVRMNPS
jgi:hypothetical protein